MIVKDTDGKERKWNYSKNYNRKNRSGKSKYHIKARNLLNEIFPYSSLYEEVTLPNDPVLYADFFIPDKSLIVEVHGEQHYEYSPFFHKDKMSFYLAKARDRKKIEWCSINNLRIAILPFNEEDSWKQILTQI